MDFNASYLSVECRGPLEEKPFRCCHFGENTPRLDREHDIWLDKLTAPSGHWIISGTSMVKWTGTGPLVSIYVTEIQKWGRLSLSKTKFTWSKRDASHHPVYTGHPRHNVWNVVFVVENVKHLRHMLHIFENMQDIPDIMCGISCLWWKTWSIWDTCFTSSSTYKASQTQCMECPLCARKFEASETHTSHPPVYTENPRHNVWNVLFLVEDVKHLRHMLHIFQCLQGIPDIMYGIFCLW